MIEESVLRYMSIGDCIEMKRKSVLRVTWKRFQFTGNEMK